MGNAANMHYNVTANNRSAMAVMAQTQAKGQQVSSKLAGMGKGMGKAVAGIGIGAAVFAGIKSMTTYADKIEDTSKKLRLATDDVQALERAAMLGGVELETISSGMTKIDDAAQDAIGGNAKKDAALDKLGITDQDRKTLNKKDLLVKASQGVEKLGTAEGDQAFADIFGSKLGPAMRQVADEIANIEKTKQDMIDSGKIMKDEDIAALAAFNDELDVFKNELMVQLTPALTGVLAALKWFWYGIYDLTELVGTAIGAFAAFITDFDIVGLVKSFGENFVNTIKAIFDNAWALISGKKSIGEVISSMMDQYGSNVMNTLNKTFGKDNVAVAGQVIHDKLTEQAERDKQREREAAQRAALRQAQQDSFRGTVNRTGTVKTEKKEKKEKEFKPETLESVGNLSFGGTAAINAQQRMQRLSEKSLEYQEKIHAELVKQREIMEREEEEAEE